MSEHPIARSFPGNPFQRAADEYSIPSMPISATPSSVSLPDPESFRLTLVWRAISHRYRYGHWEYLYDDPVLADHMGTYLVELGTRGAIKVTLDRLGTYEELASGNQPIKHMAGAGSLVKERKLHRLEEYP